jgi:hypothetical protein
MLVAGMPKPSNKEGVAMAQSYEEGLDAFLAEAREAYAQMFGAERQAQLKTFSQREICVYEAGRHLSRALLEAHLARDKQSQPAAQDAVQCPRCQRAGQRVKDAAQEVRPMTTLVGNVTFARAKYRCAHCRKIFSRSTTCWNSERRGAARRS